MLLAELVLVMVPTSVEDERMFKSMKYLEKIPSAACSSTRAPHSVCKGVQEQAQCGGFPEAIGAGLNACKMRGRYGPSDETFCGLASGPYASGCQTV